MISQKKIFYQKNVRKKKIGNGCLPYYQLKCNITDQISAGVSKLKNDMVKRSFFQIMQRKLKYYFM